MRKLLLASSLIAAACADPDPCIAAHQTAVTSPSGYRRATVFSGPCEGASPQVLLEFARSGTGTGLFAVADSVMNVDVRWVSEDTLEVVYPAHAHIVQQRAGTQGTDERVFVRYVPRSD